VPSLPGTHRDWKPSFNPWLVAITVTLATFMEVLDSSIANVALPHIAGSLGATYEESTWVLTSYLVSSAIVLPVSGWLSTLIGRKRFYMTCVALFTTCSFLCGIAPSLPLLIFARVLQGAGGGGLQPSEQAILADSFPPEKRGVAFAMYGMAVVVAPAIGPVLGGWITDNFNWHWIFFINIPVGILSLFLTQRMVEDPPWLKEERKSGIKIDYIGLSLIVIGIACFQFVLDKGQEDDWFNSKLILTTFCIGVPLLFAFFLWEWFHDDPIVDVRLLKNRNFGTAVFFSFILGIVLFGSTVLIPEFLQSSLGYTAERAGMALSPGGMVLVVMMPVAGLLLQTKVDPRLLVSIGFLGTAITLHLMTIIYLQIDFHTVVALRMIQVIFMPLIFIPISTLNYIGVPREKSNQVSGLSNFSRNIGGSIGTSMLSTFLARQNQIHQTALTAHTNNANGNYLQMVSGLKGLYLSQGFDAVTAGQKALATMYRTVSAQAGAMSFENAFWMMSVLISCLVPLPFIMRRPPKGGKREVVIEH
jgi:DHA2 family multidrug resistance protein